MDSKSEVAHPAGRYEFSKVEAVAYLISYIVWLPVLVWMSFGRSTAWEVGGVGLIVLTFLLNQHLLGRAAAAGGTQPARGLGIAFREGRQPIVDAFRAVRGSRNARR